MNKISGVVITYNREDVLDLCLRSMRFVDELIVVDKSSTDNSSEIANRYADRVVSVPWSPTVEETRAYAISLCSYDWIVSLDDDECLNLAAVDFIRSEVQSPRYDIYEISFRHYVLGRHDERAYYWPEHRYALFRRGAIEFTATVHGGVHPRSRSILTLSPEAAPCIHHLSHRDTATWIEKTNRYTSRDDRRSDFSDDDLASVGAFARARLDRWLDAVPSPDNYLESVAALRGVYDIIDGVKRWEVLESGGAPPFAAIREQLESEFPGDPPRPPAQALAARPMRSAEARAADAEARAADAEARASEAQQAALNGAEARRRAEAELAAAQAEANVRMAELRAQLEIARTGWLKNLRLKTRKYRRALFGATRGRE